MKKLNTKSIISQSEAGVKLKKSVTNQTSHEKNKKSGNRYISFKTRQQEKIVLCVIVVKRKHVYLSDPWTIVV